ncbi:MAG: gamma-glutamyl-gamma-aminobutyrate hydrolase [Pelagibacteraceae bacterium]|nr:gamma-glutamyl-gamma-aminobutyrate hydrolase [Pelagibacteraceae bacterium]|tara:strand:- start:13695 stop:14405 length:711 start_codon:yes stop_codon:yes gene_type:complete
MKKALIGITLDSEQGGDYSKYPWYAIRENYLSSIYKFNAIPFPLFHEIKSITQICHKIDGLIITGGNFDINPILYGNNNSSSRLIKNQRTNFEIKLFKKFFLQNKPILGICGGQQLINVACGGNLIQDIKEKNKNSINHEQTNPRNQTSHKIDIKKNTKLYKIIKSKNVLVNSAHHQSVDKLGKNLVISALAKDNIIEAIEHSEHKWCIGVQWHPEFLITAADNALIKNFIKETKI